jgi:hypothetical protein
MKRFINIEDDHGDRHLVEWPQDTDGTTVDLGKWPKIITCAIWAIWLTVIALVLITVYRFLTL